MSQSPQPSRSRGPEPKPDPKAAGVSSRYLLAQLRRAVDFHLRGDYLSAETILRAALRVDAEQPQAHHHLAVVLHAQRQFLDAERHLALAHGLDPHQPGIVARLGQYRRDAGRHAA